MTTSTDRVIQEVLLEIARADEKFGTEYSSMHEAYGVLVEEVDEFFDEVRRKQDDREPDKMRKELVQVAAVALRAARMLWL